MCFYYYCSGYCVAAEYVVAIKRVCVRIRYNIKFITIEYGKAKYEIISSLFSLYSSIKIIIKVNESLERGDGVLCLFCRTIVWSVSTMGKTQVTKAMRAIFHSKNKAFLKDLGTVLLVQKSSA